MSRLSCKCLLTLLRVQLPAKVFGMSSGCFVSALSATSVGCVGEKRDRIQFCATSAGFGFPIIVKRSEDFDQLLRVDFLIRLGDSFRDIIKACGELFNDKIRQDVVGNFNSYFLELGKSGLEVCDKARNIVQIKYESKEFLGYSGSVLSIRGGKILGDSFPYHPSVLLIGVINPVGLNRRVQF